jgi:hypothetical protein
VPADWTTTAADAIEQFVATLRDRTVVPAQRATRAIVFGLLTMAFATVAFILLLIGGFRALVVLCGDVWLAYLVLGTVLVLLGAFCWSKRSAPDDAPTTPVTR